MIYHFEVEGEPKAKGRPRFTKAGFTYTPKETASYENWIKTCFVNKYPEHKPLQGHLEVMIMAFFGIPKSKSKKFRDQAIKGEIHPEKKPDADNIAKTVLDALNGMAFEDDKQVTDLVVYKRYAAQPRVEVVITAKE